MKTRLQGGFFAVGCALTAGSGGAVEDTDGTGVVGLDWAGNEARTGSVEVEAGGLYESKGLLTELATAATGGVAVAVLVGRG